MLCLDLKSIEYNIYKFNLLINVCSAECLK